jgi:hypothetical protein
MDLIEPDLVTTRLQAAYGLRVLSLWLDRSSTYPQIVMRLTAATTDGAVDEIALLTCGYAEVGLPAGSSGESMPDTAFRLPAHVEHALAQALAQLSLNGEPLWLRLMTPVGLLPVVPWERLLAPIANAPVLRLPYHEISPTPPKGRLDCVVCFSSPAAKEALAPDVVLGDFLHNLPPEFASYATVHVFADAEAQPALALLRSSRSTFEIRIYDPAEAERMASSAARTYGHGRRLTNPWLKWIRSALGRSADVVHFLSHCYLSGEEGALALAESPSRNTDRSTSQLVWADELVAFLNEVGAWSLGLSSPRGNYSLTGMRLLQDEVARLRPGPCLLHDMVQPASAEAFGAAYRFLYLPGWHPAPQSGAVALYCHPWHQARDARLDVRSEAILQDLTLVGRVDEHAFASPGSGWLATTQRVLEQSATQLSTPAERDDDVAVESGRKDALRFVAEAIARNSQGTDPLAPPEAAMDKMPGIPPARRDES